MSIIDYRQSQAIMSDGDFSFYSLIMAAMRKADTDNLEKLKSVFPEVYGELRARYNAPGGALDSKEMRWVQSVIEERENEQ